MTSFYSRPLFFVGLLLVVSWQAHASSSVMGVEGTYPDDHPCLSPQRDVVVTYRFQTGNQQADVVHMKQVKASFAASGDRLRIDQSGEQGVTILDRPAQRVTLISMADHSYMQFMPMHGLRNPFLLDLSMHYHAGTKGRIAGFPCQNWTIEGAQGHASACVTEDGVILSETGVDADGISGHLEALDVVYQDIPASQFEPPADFHKIMPYTAAGYASEAQPPAGTTAPDAASEALSGMVPDTSQPHVSNDSVSDGTVQRADQPGSSIP